MVLSKPLLLIALLGLAGALPECNGQPGGGTRETTETKDGQYGTSKSPSKQSSNQVQNQATEQTQGGGGGGGGGTNLPPSSQDVSPASAGPIGTGKRQYLKHQNEGPGANLGSVKSTVTVYGSGDHNGSGNCKKQQACGFWASQGYSAAVSQNLYGVGSGQGNGPGCGTCWKITLETDGQGRPLPPGPNGQKRQITVVVDNLCPPGGNSICAMPTFNSKNQYGATLNFDLCQDTGAQGAAFGGSGIGMGIGYAVKVDCGAWDGEISGKPWHNPKPNA